MQDGKRLEDHYTLYIFANWYITVINDLDKTVSTTYQKRKLFWYQKSFLALYRDFITTL